MRTLEIGVGTWASRQAVLGVAAISGAVLSGCATASDSFMGIDITSDGKIAGQLGAADGTVPDEPELRSLTAIARAAQAGDKQAQLELGIRFEEGRGVPRDLKKARKLYTQAGRDTGGTLWIYTPPVGNGTRGQTIPVAAGAKQMGLAEAKRRLIALDQLKQ